MSKLCLYISTYVKAVNRKYDKRLKHLLANKRVSSLYTGHFFSMNNAAFSVINLMPAIVLEGREQVKYRSSDLNWMARIIQVFQFPIRQKG